MRAVRVVVIQGAVQLVLVFASRGCLVIVKKTQGVLTCILVQAVSADDCNWLSVLIRESDYRRGRRVHFLRRRILRLMDTRIDYGSII